MKLLLTNADGIDGEGLRALAEELSKEHELLIVAPTGNRSANSHLMTIGKPMSLQTNDNFPGKAFALDGSPVDCVKFAHEMLPEYPFEAVVSGINCGPNLGTDAMYSGTVGAAVEGAFLGYPSIAFSSCSPKNNLFDLQAKLALQLLPKLIATATPRIAWNVNFPNIPKEEIKGAKFCRLGRMEYLHHYEKMEGGYRLRGEYASCPNLPESDLEQLKQGYVAIAPVVVDLTDEGIFAKYKSESILL